MHKLSTTEGTLELVAEAVRSEVEGNLLSVEVRPYRRTALRLRRFGMTIRS
jgi:hypothetical protein